MRRRRPPPQLVRKGGGREPPPEDSQCCEEHSKVRIACDMAATAYCVLSMGPLLFSLYKYYEEGGSTESLLCLAASSLRLFSAVMLYIGVNSASQFCLITAAFSALIDSLIFGVYSSILMKLQNYKYYAPFISCAFLCVGYYLLKMFKH